MEGRNVIISAAPGFDLVSVGTRDGALRAIPIIAWMWQVAESGEVTGPPVPLTCGLLPWESDKGYAIRLPSGEILDNPLTGRTFPTVDEWIFAVRAGAIGHNLHGTA